MKIQNSKFKIQILFLILFSVFSFQFSVAYAQQAETEPPKPPEAEEPISSENVTLDFKDADITSVLKIIAYKSGVNIVSTPEVRGTVTIRLKDVPWEQALETIVRTYGFAFEWISNKVIMVSTLARLAEQRKIQEEAVAKEPLGTQTFILNFTKAEDVKVAVEKLLSDRAKITLEARSNTLIITDTKSNLIRIGRIIEELDKVTPQVRIEAKVIEMTLGDADKLGIDWTMKVTAGGGRRPTTFPFSKWATDRNMLPTSKYSWTEAYVEDKTQWVANPNADPADPTTAFIHPFVKKSTVTSDFPFKGDLLYPNDAFSLASFPMAQPYFSEGVLSGDFAFGTLDFSQFQAVLEVLKSRSDTKIVSNPRITTVNNKEAKIIVGTVVPIPIYTYSKEQGTRVISGYRDQEVGIRLLVTPNINERDFVTLTVKPSVDEIIGWTGPDDERPIISTRSAETIVMIKDGETLVIAGLISEKTIKKRTKLPILGDIPILGLLFSKREDTLDKTELVIFVTPHIVREGQISPAEETLTSS